MLEGPDMPPISRHACCYIYCPPSCVMYNDILILLSVMVAFPVSSFTMFDLRMKKRNKTCMYCITETEGSSIK